MYKIERCSDTRSKILYHNSLKKFKNQLPCLLFLMPYAILYPLFIAYKKSNIKDGDSSKSTSNIMT